MNEEGYTNEDGYVYVKGYVNVARHRDADARMVFVRRIKVKLRELSSLWSIGEYYGDERHNRERLRFDDRGGGKLFADRGYDGVTKVLCRRPEEGGVGIGEPVAAPLLAGLGGSRRDPQEGQDDAGRAELGWVVAASSLRFDLAPPDL